MIKDIRSIQVREDLLTPRQNFRMMVRQIGQELKRTLRMNGKRKTSKVVDLNIVKHIRSKSGQSWLVGAEEIV